MRLHYPEPTLYRDSAGFEVFVVVSPFAGFLAHGRSPNGFVGESVWAPSVEDAINRAVVLLNTVRAS